MAQHLGLDVAEPQVAIHYPDDPNNVWHGRLLLRRLQNATWIWLTPDMEVQVADLALLAVVPVARGARVPNAIERDLYWFAAISADALATHHATASRLADVLGAAAPAAADQVAGTSHWRVADTGHPRFNAVIATDLVVNAATGVAKGSRGLVKQPIDDGEEWVFVERVLDADLSKWLDLKTAGPGRDRRIAGSKRGADGRRHVPLADALGTFRPLDLSTVSDWPHQGPRASVEVLSGIRNLGRELVTYHDLWLGTSGLNPKSPHRYEHKVLTQALSLLVSFDQVDASNLASAELMCRRLVQIERAVRAAPHAPSFLGLAKMIDMNLDEAGGLRADAFTKHFASLAETDGKILKQLRLLQEETAAAGKAAGEDDDPAAGGRRRRGKNA